MEIGIAFPKVMPPGESDRIVEWAKRADDGPFSSLAMVDRLVYGNHDPLIVFAVAAAVTTRIRLMPTVLLMSLRNAAIVAKQVASIDAVSGGRFSLGVGVGSRADDFAAAGVSMKGRGKRLDEQVAMLRRIWSGEPAAEGAGPIGPPPARSGGPELLIGGRSAPALERAGRLGDGYVAGAAGAGVSNQSKEVAGYYRAVEAAWKDAGKPGKPRLVVALSCAVGEYAAERTRESMRSYYAFRGEAAKRMDLSVPSTPEAILDGISVFEDIGADELILEPGHADLDQIDRLAEIVASR